MVWGTFGGNKGGGSHKTVKDPWAPQIPYLEQGFGYAGDLYNRGIYPGQWHVDPNQMQQDSTALKEQMQKQMEEQKATKEEFKKNLEQNEELQQMQKELEDQGYQKTGEKLNAESNNTGEFEYQYEKDGEKAEISGKMDEGEMTDLQKTSTEQTKDALQKLAENPRFQEYNQELTQEGYKPTETRVEQQKNWLKQERICLTGWN